MGREIQWPDPATTISQPPTVLLMVQPSLAGTRPGLAGWDPRGEKC